MRFPPGMFTIPARGAAIKGVGIFKVRNGTLVFQAWPQKRQTPPTPAELANRETLYWSTQVVKIMDGYQQDFALRLSQQTQLARNDFLYIALFGRIGTLIRPDGRKLFSMAAMQDVSKTLDAIWQTKNGILVRGKDWWEGLAPGAVGDLLTIDGNGDVAWLAAPPTAVIAPEPILGVPPINPTIGTTWAGGAFIGRPFRPNNSFTITGFRVWCTAAGTSRRGLAGIYQAHASDNTLTSGALLSAGSDQAIVAGLNTFPLTTPVTVTAGQWYYGGISVYTGTGTMNFARSDIAHDVQYFSRAASGLPSTAPTASDSQGTAFGVWAY